MISFKHGRTNYDAKYTAVARASHDFVAREQMEAHSRSLRLRAGANRFGKHDSMTIWRSDHELSKSPALVGRLGDHLRTS